jgi:hypothetical protein
MRLIDKKFHIESEQIVKTSNGEAVPEDEPLFLLRARDRLAAPLLHVYGLMSIKDGCTAYHMDLLRVLVEEFEAFVREHPERMKQPGSTMGK